MYGKLLSNLVNNFNKGIHKTKYGHSNEKLETFGIKDCECCLEYTNGKDDLIEYKCLSCNKICQNILMKT